MMTFTCQYRKQGPANQCKTGKSHRPRTTSGKTVSHAAYHEYALGLYNLLSMIGFDGSTAALTGITRKVKSISYALLVACIFLSTSSGWAQEKKNATDLVVAAAADLSTALKEIADI